MSAWLIAAVGVVYAVIALEQWAKGHTALGITFAGYAFSNIGLYLAAR
jgi:hypothetical protein